jgi:hypothetical protein
MVRKLMLPECSIWNILFHDGRKPEQIILK